MRRKPTKWSWMAPVIKQPSTPFGLSLRIPSFILKITPRVPNGGGGKTPPTFKNVNFLKMRNRGQNLVYREEKIICFENLENREEKENFNINISKNERRKRNVFSTSWKSRGERDMKIHFSSWREKTKSNFSLRDSRDRDSCQGLLGMSDNVKK